MKNSITLFTTKHNCHCCKSCRYTVTLCLGTVTGGTTVSGGNALYLHSCFSLSLLKIVKKIISKVSHKCSNLWFQSVFFFCHLHFTHSHFWLLTLTDKQQPVLTAISVSSVYISVLWLVCFCILPLTHSICWPQSAHIYSCAALFHKRLTFVIFSPQTYFPLYQTLFLKISLIPTQLL